MHIYVNLLFHTFYILIIHLYKMHIYVNLLFQTSSEDSFFSPFTSIPAH